MKSTNQRAQVLAAYHGAPLLVKLFLRLRWQLTFFSIFLEYLPPKGTILDIGSGHGLFSLLAAMTSPDRQAFGFDPDKERIAIATAAAASNANVLYSTSWPEHLPDSSLAAVSCIDVFYLLPPPAKIRLVGWIFQKLAPGGTFLLKINGKKPRWKYAVTYVEEWLMTRLGPTQAEGNLSFWSVDQYRDLLRETGFSIDVDQPLGRWLPQTHHLFVAHKSPIPATSAYVPKVIFG